MFELYNFNNSVLEFFHFLSEQVLIIFTYAHNAFIYASLLFNAIKIYLVLIFPVPLPIKLNLYGFRYP